MVEAQISYHLHSLLSLIKIEKFAVQTVVTKALFCVLSQISGINILAQLQRTKYAINETMIHVEKKGPSRTLERGGRGSNVAFILWKGNLLRWSYQPPVKPFLVSVSGGEVMTQ